MYIEIGTEATCDGYDSAWLSDAAIHCGQVNAAIVYGCDVVTEDDVKTISRVQLQRLNAGNVSSGSDITQGCINRELFD